MRDRAGLNNITNEYFEWLYSHISDDDEKEGFGWRKLAEFLHSKTFSWVIPRDANRADDGFRLRYRFTMEMHYPDEVMDEYDIPCTVLEMMIGISLRCEETIMDDPLIGDRTRQWFWGMVSSLGFHGMYDSQFDEDEAEFIINRFLSREYDYDGRGGLFTIPNCDRDLREVEIWYQLCWYLDTMIGY